jgi:hypothetical protein
MGSRSRGEVNEGVTQSLAIVCEAPADRRTATELADRVICTSVDWISPELLDAFRLWRGETDADPCLLWREVQQRAKAKNIRVYGKFAGEPGAPDAAVARKALYVLYGSSHRPDAVVLIRDDDMQTERRIGLEQARRWASEHLKDVAVVVIGLAHTKRECWVLAGYDPANEREKKVLAELEAELGFSPCAAAHRLTAKLDHELRSAKWILGLLTGQDPEREAVCWLAADLGTLEARGNQTGLAAYFNELRERLVPLFTPPRPTP